MKHPPYILLCLCLGFINFTLSQSVSFSHINYTMNDGLPSSQVYSAFQDSKGYMWFATDAGVSRFNGYEFENFNTNNGLTDNTVFLIREDQKGRIWFGTFNCQLSYYYKGKIHPYKYNDRILKTLSGKGQLQSFSIDEYNNIWMGFIRKGLVKVTFNGKINHYKRQAQEKTIFINQDSGSFAWGFDWVKPPWQYSNSNYRDTICIRNEGTTACFFNPIIGSHNREFEKKTVDKVKDEIFYYLYGDKAYLINPKTCSTKVVHGFSFIHDHVFSTLYDGKFLWLSVQRQGVFQCQLKSDSIEIVNHYFDGQDISRVYIDKHESLWFLSLNNGIYFLPSNKISVDIPKGVRDLEIDTVDKRIFVLTENDKLFESSITENNDRNPFELISENKCKHIKYNYTDSSLLYCNELGIHQIKDSFHSKLVSNDWFRDLVVKSDTFFGISNSGLFFVRKIDTNFIFEYSGSRFENWCSSIIDYNNTIILGTNLGLKVYKRGKVTDFSGHQFFSSSISSFEKYTHHLLVGTKENGLLVVKGNGLLRRITTADGLPSNLIRSIHVDMDRNIWVGTNKGLVKLNLRDDYSCELVNLSRKHGLISNEIMHIKSYGNLIYVGTPAGLVKLDKSQLSKNLTPMEVYITSFKVNSQNSKNDYELSYDQNFIKIDFEGLNYKSMGEVVYEYRLIGVDSKWRQTMLRTVEYPSLPPGEYRFEVRAQNEDGVWSDPVVLSFTISPPFWQTTWFILSVVLFFIALIILAFKLKLLVYNKHVQQEIFNRLLKKLGKQDYVFIEVDKQKIRINDNEILYVQSYKNYVEINTRSKKYLYRSTLNKMEDELNKLKFIRVHRSFIVQKNKIDGIAEKHLTIGSEKIPIGKTYQGALKEFNEEFFRLNS